MEDLDDVSVRGPDGATLIQVKNEAKGLNNLNDGFWKALANWAREAARLLSDDESIREFVFATTAPITGDLPKAFLIQDPSSRASYFLRQLESIASDDQDINKSIQTLKALDSTRLRRMLSRIRIENTGGENELRAQIKQALWWQRAFPEGDLESAADQFEGWFNRIVLHDLNKGKGARISGRLVRDTLQNLRNQFAKRQRRYVHFNTPIGEDDRKACHARLFFRQLKEIDLPSVALDSALVDFLREQWERDQLTTDLTVSREELVRYDSDLYEGWKHKFQDIAQERSRVDEKHNGRQLYDAVMDKSLYQLGGELPPLYVHRGSYHRLADASHIGWHPRWQQIFGGPEDEGAVTDTDSEPSDE